MTDRLMEKQDRSCSLSSRDVDRAVFGFFHGHLCKVRATQETKKRTVSVLQFLY